MLYLVMGLDDARGTMNFDAPWFEPDGRMTIEWDNAGQQILFTRMNEELRRHARALSANFISNPTWSVFQTRHLITAHPLGGCPMGEDYQHGAVDEFGRVFSGDGSVHDGLFVADGSLIPSALGVNPFLTISAIAERIAERKIRDMQRRRIPEAEHRGQHGGIDPLDVIGWSEPSLERLFRRSTTLPIDKIVNKGGPPQPDIATRTVRNDGYWKGFFPQEAHPEYPLLRHLHGLQEELRKARRQVCRPHQRHRRPHHRAQLARRGDDRPADRHARARQVHPAALPGSAVGGLLRHLQDHQRRPDDRPRLPRRVSRTARACSPSR